MTQSQNLGTWTQNAEDKHVQTKHQSYQSGQNSANKTCGKETIKKLNPKYLSVYYSATKKQEQTNNKHKNLSSLSWHFGNHPGKTKKQLSMCLDGWGADKKKKKNFRP